MTDPEDSDRKWVAALATTSVSMRKATNHATGGPMIWES